ncbi:MAG: hypothetical protein JNG83_02620 [Opitutaceae bacterium]|nr:hypothetical protein [Opitutaceae bacterium]
MNQTWKVIVVLVGIFVAGGVTGSFVTQRYLREKLANRPGPEQWAPRHLKRLAERLELTPAQEEQVKPIVRRNMEELNRVRASSLAETRQVFERMEREIAAQLTPEQKAKFEQMNREFRERARKFNLERSGGGPRPAKERPEGERPPPPPDGG